MVSEIIRLLIDYIPTSLHRLSSSPYYHHSRRLEFFYEKEQERKRKNDNPYYIITNNNGCIYKTRRLYHHLDCAKEAIIQIKKKDPNFLSDIWECEVDKQNQIMWHNKRYVDFYTVGQKFTPEKYDNRTFLLGGLHLTYDDVTNSIKDRITHNIQMKWWTFTYFPVPVYLVKKL
jgi:hypothetical protein